MTNLVTSYIRTYVPVIVGYLIAWLLSLGIVVDQEATAGLILFVGAFATGAYYAVARLIERRWPGVGGFLLGSSAQPVYKDPEITSKKELN